MEKSINKKEKTRELHEFFLSLWDDREDNDGYCYCYECGKPMWRGLFRNNSACYSHLLPKSKYPELALKTDNVVIVHDTCHAQFESNPVKTPRQKQAKEKIYKKYIDV